MTSNYKQLFAVLLEMLQDPAWLKDGDGKYLQVNQPFAAFVGLDPNTVIGKSDMELFPYQQMEFIRQSDRQAIEQQKSVSFSHIMLDDDGNDLHVELIKTPVFAEDGTLNYIMGVARNVTKIWEQKRDHSLLKEKQSETEASLRVLLDLRERDKIIIESRMIESLSDSVQPYLRKLLQSPLDSVQKLLLDSALTNLSTLLNTHNSSMANVYLNLTPAEMQVAQLIRKGLTGKEIAFHLSLSPATIATHRRNIRKRLGLKQKKINLRQYLLAHSS